MKTAAVSRALLLLLVVALCPACSENGSPTAASSTGLGSVADFGGQYLGTYRMTTCTADGIFSGFCEATDLTSGTDFSIYLSLTQNSSSLTGNLTLGSLTGSFQGSGNGATLTGSAVMADVSDAGVIISTTITNWNTTLSSNALTGTFTIVMRVPGQTGSASLTATITQLAR